MSGCGGRWMDRIVRCGVKVADSACGLRGGGERADMGERGGGEEDGTSDALSQLS